MTLVPTMRSASALFLRFGKRHDDGQKPLLVHFVISVDHPAQRTDPHMAARGDRRLGPGVDARPAVAVPIRAADEARVFGEVALEAQPQSLALYCASLLR